ncbi:unnamed protein product [Mytilus edulis]|uniref:Farnesoic acid O-methyl transferase domain-containing protein n=1 Tax=Mytilus edulis TaxID=6550 RepID=A0A8S3RDZ4_MYTED|nr:unnamed protein product [Mytilus edulis]
MLPELSQSISDRIISFKVQACSNAYVGLISGTDETDPLYEITIEFCITWDDNTINVRRGLDVTGSLFLSWTSGTDLWPILNVGICTSYHGATGNWIFNTQGLQTTTDEGTTLHKGIPSTDLLISTDETSHPPTIGTVLFSTLYDGISTRPQTFKPTLTTHYDTTEQPKNTSPAISTTDAQSYNNACSWVCPKALGKPTSKVPVTQLKIDKKTLSSYKRKQQCATDPRKSSYYIGCVGLTILILYFAFIVLLDCLPKV